MRRRQIDELCQPGSLNVKYGRGGIIDIEYAVQYCQMAFGAEHVQLRTPNVVSALQALNALGILSSENFNAAKEAYILIRYIIDALRILRGQSKDLTLPPLDIEDADFLCLAKRLGYW